MNPTLIAILAVIVGGALTALQGPTNARLAGAVASPVNAALISFAVGTVALMILAAAYAVPKLGVATTIVLMVAGQMMLSLILDHFGFMGVPKQPITLTRLAGVAMLIGGVLLVRKP